jgi:hypothetical protein
MLTLIATALDSGTETTYDAACLVGLAEQALEGCFIKKVAIPSGVKKRANFRAGRLRHRQELLEFSGSVTLESLCNIRHR